MTSTVSSAPLWPLHWMVEFFLFFFSAQGGQHRCPLFCFFCYSSPIPISTRHAFILFRYSRHPTSPSSHPVTFSSSPSPSVRPSIHPSTRCVMSLLCESEQFVWQPECNATPLTWESQQSVVLVRETCLGAAVHGEFHRKRTSTGAELKTKKGTTVNIRSSG